LLAVQTTSPNRPETRRSVWSELFPALRQHVYRAKLIIYGSLLIAGVVQIIIRERFPAVHPPWAWIGGALMTVLFCVLVIPPVLLVLRLRRARKSEGHETNS
jgi:hypothetical protein